MNISKEEIIHMSKLASLNLTDTEIERYTKDMEDILGFANTINQVNTEDISESFVASEKYNVFSKDEVKEFEDKEILLQNAPSSEAGMFHIPKVI